jgi:hypothetical protein
METIHVQKIVSGGQTGVDRGALDVAIALGMEHGGWCPRGRIAEDGRIPPMYQLTEMATSEYWVRTEKNVVDSDGTLILYRERLSGGTEFTYRMTRKHGKPCHLVDLAVTNDPQDVRDWIADHEIGVLNVAGPRESSYRGISDEARHILTEVLRPSSQNP